MSANIEKIGEVEKGVETQHTRAMGAAGAELVELTSVEGATDRAPKGDDVLRGDGISPKEAKDINGLGGHIDLSEIRRHPELMDEWGKNRANENYRFLQSKNPHLAYVYKQMIEDQEFYRPGLEAVQIGQMGRDDIQNMGPANAYFVAARRMRGTAKSAAGDLMAPMIRFNFDDTDAYTREHTDFKGHLQGLDIVLTSLALRTGAKPGDLVKNPKFVQAFVFLHEFGHAQDFMERAGKESLDKYGVRTKRALPGVLEHWIKLSRREEMTMPKVAGGSDALADLFYGRYAERDVKSNHEAKVLQQTAYRRKGMEFYADNFATAYMMKHYDEYFCDMSDTQGIAEGKIPTRLNYYMKVGENLVPALEFTAGTGVEVQVLDENWKPRGKKARRVFLDSALRRGERLKLSVSGDPLDTRPESHQESKGVIEEVGIVPRRVNGKIEVTTYVKIENGVRFAMRRSGEEPPEIEETVQEMSQRLDIRPGQVLRIMKRELTGDSYVGEGKILSGKLRSPFQMGHSVVLDDAGDNIDHGNTSAVTKIKRKWRTYYFETSGGPRVGGSVYEILRGKKDKRP